MLMLLCAAMPLPPPSAGIPPLLSAAAGVSAVVAVVGVGVRVDVAGKLRAPSMRSARRHREYRHGDGHLHAVSLSEVHQEL